MLELTETLLAAQKEHRINPIYKITLTHGGTTDVYDKDSNRILDISGTFQPHSHKAKVLFDNANTEFTSLDYKGWEAVVSRGIHTENGDEYMDWPRMYVTAHELYSSPGHLTCELQLEGIPDALGDDQASNSYKGSNIDITGKMDSTTAINSVAIDLTNLSRFGEELTESIPNLSILYIGEDPTRYTVTAEAEVTDGGATVSISPYLTQVALINTEVTIIPPGTYNIIDFVNDLLSAALPPFDHCEAYTVVWDDPNIMFPDTMDDPLLLYQPRGNFRVKPGNTRLSALNQLLAFTDSVWKVVGDEIHIFKPMTIGESSYEYELEPYNHTFFAKTYRQKLVNPNYIVVRSPDEIVPEEEPVV